MTHCTAWIVSDDAGLAADLCAKLQPLRDCQVGVSSAAQWLESQSPVERPQWLLLDLRGGRTLARELWQDLPNVRRRSRHLAGSPLPCIAIVDQGYPIEATKQATRVLTASCGWPMSTEGFATVLRQAEQGAQDFLRHAGIESRAVRSASYTFRTYTPALFPLLDRLETAARHEFTILLVGETGTGKTTLAGMIHELSPRREKRFLTVACGALPGELIDSELFGHVRGAFTGADREKSGKFAAADEGTILLDEIDVLGLLQQAKLLRVLETGEFEPIGSNDTQRVRCRTIVASNTSLELLMEKRQFRSDLFYRLNQVKFEIPPLRERPLDIIPLAVDFIDECRREHGLDVHTIHPDLLTILMTYAWPGNIRELRNEVRRCVLFCRDGVVTPEALSLALLQQSSRQPAAPGTASPQSVLAQDIATTERDSIEHMLRKQRFNRAATARALGISRVTLYNKIRKYHINLAGAGENETAAEGDGG
jgi:transcriptional regulator with PAS, ATPase and Fis domain